MAESNSQPTRCPCGFFGSSQTLGLCSKCFREREQNRDQQLLTADAARSSSVSMEMRMERETASFPDDSPRNNLTPRVGTDAAENRAKETEVPRVASSTVTDDGTDSVSPESQIRRGRKRKADEMEDEGEGKTGVGEEDGRLDPVIAADDEQGQPPVQRNKKRCFKCNCRMDLAIREIGKCKCDYIFCPLHRLPEQHGCTFDHKEHCRQEARAKMVVLKKHVGTALKRLDSDS